MDKDTKEEGDSMLAIRKTELNTMDTTNNTDIKVLDAIKKSNKKHAKMMRLLAK